MGAALCLTFSSAVTRAEPAPLDHAWELASQLRLREADQIFRPLIAQGDREAAFGSILTQWELPPSSTEKLALVRQQLQALVQANPDDETGIRARYVLGRIQQLYGSTPGTGDASELAELIRDHPVHYLSQLAVVKLVLHRLYATSPVASDPQRFTDAEQAGAQILNPGLQRDFHLVMGDAYLYFGDQRTAALKHYRTAESIGIPDAATRATVLVQIGELARLEGQPDVAAAAYRKFLAEFQRDIRKFEVHKRLAALEATP